MNEKRIEGISDMRDESDRKGLRLVIELKQNAVPAGRAQQPLQAHVSCRPPLAPTYLALVNGVPKHAHPASRCCYYYIDHQERRRDAAHPVRPGARPEPAPIFWRACCIALDNIDEVINIIRSSRTDAEAVGAHDRALRPLARSRPRPSWRCACKRLTGLERDKIQEELDEPAPRRSTYYEDLLAEPAQDSGRHQGGDARRSRSSFATKRRTEISHEGTKELDVEDLIADEDMVVTITHAGYVKRLPVATYRSQNRGGKGMQGVNLKENDFVERIFRGLHP